MQWSKKLSRTDAQQETRGGLMPFRFTHENCPGNFVTWFREDFFDELDWKDTTWRDYQQEEADIAISVNIQGEDLGQRTMKLTHAERRNKNNNAPATHLNFDEVTREYLQDNDMTGKEIKISKDDLTGGFELVIQDSEP
ncbi:MAG: hypothetical protein LBQ93_06875 [Treponema sp.]|jgi:hypothetical protein|nr:hypothetical protein [Treponema sp.]